MSDSSSNSLQKKFKQIFNDENFLLDRLNKAICKTKIKSNENFCGKDSKIYMKIAESVIKVLKEKGIKNVHKLKSTELAAEALKDLQNNPETIKELIKIEGKTGYSQASLNCVINDFIFNKATPDVKTCLENTLSISEKIGILVSSYRSNHGLDNFIQTPLAKMIASKQEIDPILLDQIALRMENEPINCLLDFFFPLDIKDTTIWVKNHIYRYQIEQLSSEEQKHQLFKYIPLGLNYQSPSEEVEAFLRHLKTHPINPLILEKLPFLNVLPSLIELSDTSTSEISMEQVKNIYEKLQPYL